MLLDASFGRREAYATRLDTHASLLILTTLDLIASGPEINAVDETRLSALLDRLCGVQPRPNVVFCDTDMIVPGVYRGLQRRGIVPGRDVEVVGYNNDLIYLAGLAPMPVTADVRAVELGRMAAERLLWRLSHPADPVVTMTIRPHLVIAPLAP
ncbi:MAG: substrate-binding domain-containing protein [Phycisphaerales bacterium]|nr:substrate-binding domain-containing protein [Phycisphaerales bacterium]